MTELYRTIVSRRESALRAEADAIIKSATLSDGVAMRRTSTIAEDAFNVTAVESGRTGSESIRRESTMTPSEPKRRESSYPLSDRPDSGSFSPRINDGDEPLPPIPGTRRLGNRKASRIAIRRPSEFSLNESMPLSPRLGSRASRPPEVSIPPFSPKGLAFQQPSPHGLRMPDALPMVQDAEDFRMKRREAQLALEIIPKYTAALKLAGPTPEFESIMKNSIEMHMDDEYYDAMVEILRHRALARAFLGWKAAATSLKMQIEQNLRRPPSFCAKLELLSSQGPRLQIRGVAGSKGQSAVLNVSPTRPRVDSSVTTDASRPSVTEDHRDYKPDLPIIANDEENNDVIKHLYAEAGKVEQNLAKHQSKRVDSKRFGNFVSALGRVASFRSRQKE